MREKDMQGYFGKHLAKYPPSELEVYELKICKEKSLPFKSVQEHQIKALLKASTDGLFYKIPDPPIFSESRMRFNNPRPFDCMFVKGVKAYVVVWFYKPHASKIFIKIPIVDFINEMNTSTRKSLTEARAREIGTSFVVTNG